MDRYSNELGRALKKLRPIPPRGTLARKAPSYSAATDTAMDLALVAKFIPTAFARKARTHG